MEEKSESAKTEQKNPSFNINPDSRFSKPKYHVKMTSGAKEIIDEEQARMLINMIAHEFEKRPELNVFTFDKVGLVVIKKGTTLLILTQTEKANLTKNS